MPLDADLKILLANELIADQSELLAALAARGHVLTQSTLSRKLKGLGYHKQDGRYTQPGVPGFKLVSVTLVAPNLLVLRTAPGFAGALAETLGPQALDGHSWLLGLAAFNLGIECFQLALLCMVVPLLRYGARLRWAPLARRGAAHGVLWAGLSWFVLRVGGL